MGDIFVAGPIARPGQQVFNPLQLLRGVQGIEELRRFFRAPQLGDVVQCDHGRPHLPHSGLHHDDGALRESQLSLGQAHVLKPGSVAKHGDQRFSILPDR